MFQQQDTIHTEQPQQAPQQPVQVLQLPEDTAEVTALSARTNHWPVKVDSLLRPDDGHPVEVEVTPLPKYYKDSYWAKDSLLHAELQGGRYGIAGDPVPFSLRGDDLLTPLVIIFTLLQLFCIKRASRFIGYQMRNFFHSVRVDSLMEREAMAEKRYLLFSELTACFVLGMLFFFYSKLYISDTYITYSEYILIGIYCSCFVGLGLLERLAYLSVNSVFFTPRQKSQWFTAKTLMMALMGLMLMPMFLLVAFFGLQTENALFYTLFVIILTELMLFYKCYLVFFRKISSFVHIFLYFCTLEVVPMLILVGILMTVANYLKVKY